MSKIIELLNTTFGPDDLIKYKDLVDQVTELENEVNKKSTDLEFKISELEKTNQDASETIGKLQKNYREAISMIPVETPTETVNKEVSYEETIQTIVKGLLEEG